MERHALSIIEANCGSEEAQSQTHVREHVVVVLSETVCKKKKMKVTSLPQNDIWKPNRCDDIS